MKKQAILLAVLALALASCGVYGPKGNDVGGIIPVVAGSRGDGS